MRKPTSCVARLRVEGAEVRPVMAEQGEGAERDVGLTHPDLVGQVGDPAARQDVVNGDRPILVQIC